MKLTKSELEVMETLWQGGGTPAGTFRNSGVVHKPKLESKHHPHFAQRLAEKGGDTGGRIC